MGELYKHLLSNILLPAADLVNGSNVMKTLSILEKEVGQKEPNMKRLQNERLKKLLYHVADNNEYYKRFNIEKKEDPYFMLKRFPILEKEDIRQEGYLMVNRKERKRYPQYSSGSTGVQTKVYWGKQDFDIYRATALLWWRWAGYEIGDAILQTGITSKRGWFKRMKDILFRTYYLQAYNHTNEQADKAMLWLRKQKYPVIGGYPSSLFILADDAERKGISFNAKTCITWGDKLFDHYKEKIEKVFNTKVFETYGSAEGFLIAAQYDTPFMYIMSNNIVLEIVDDNGNEVKDGELGHVVVTNLYNFTMPLIRYRLGDLAVKLPRNEYPEKRMLDLPLLKKVIGRNTDIIRTPSGNKLVVHSFTGIFEHYQEIKQYQIVQKTLSRIDIRYIPGKGFIESVLQKIKQKLMDLTGGEIEIIFRKVENIKPSGSGKPQIIISEINNEITKK